MKTQPQSKASSARDEGRTESGTRRAVSTAEERETGDTSAASDLLYGRLAAFDTLVAGVAHELNNPMTYALAGVEVALRRLRARAARAGRDADEATALEALERALTGLSRMREIVRNLVTFVHGDPETLTILDARAVLESALQVADHQIRERARLEKELAEVPPVQANAVRLDQVFFNLLINAAEAIPEGDAARHRVRVATHANDDAKVVVEVEDTGDGIPAEVLPRVFDPFFTTKRQGSGTGLGLSIARGIVRDMRGHISVESSVGRGTVVRVELPCARSWKQSWAKSRGGGALEPAERARVLVVDDDPLVGDALALTLRDEHDVVVVTSGRDALDRLEAGETYDVILCDLLMPVMTGMDLYARLVQSHPEAAGAMIFMTGGAVTPRARAFAASVADRCVPKPIEAKELRDLVRSRTHRGQPSA